MEKDDLAADLSARLREQGVTFDPKTLNAFVSQVRRDQNQGEDAETLLDRFMEARNDHTRAVRKAYYAGHAMGFGILVCFLSLAPLSCGGFGALAFLLREPVPEPAGVIVALLLGIGMLAFGGYRAVTSSRTLIRAREDAEEAFARRRFL